MPADTDAAERRKNQRRQAVQGVVLFSLSRLVCGTFFGLLCLIPGLPRWEYTLFTVLAAVCAVRIILALTALRWRLTEIEGGELDEALKY